MPERRGLPGEPGQDGKDGKDGVAGEQGKQGEQGSKGDQGERGPQGDVGPQGPIGPEGPQGVPGNAGRDGKVGARGPAGKPGADGEDGTQGPVGPMPDHQWSGTQLRFEEPDGSWGKYVDLKGPQGQPGANGGGGGGGITPVQKLQLQTLLDIFGGWIAEPPNVSIVSITPETLSVTAVGSASGFYSSTPGGSPVDAAYEWDWGDGSTSSTLNATHTYAEEGTYTVSFRAKNHIGWSEPTSEDVTVTAAPAQWTPAQLSNTMAWYVGDNPSNTLVSGELSTISDKSGAGFDAIVDPIDPTGFRAKLSSTLNSRTVWSTDTSRKGCFLVPSAVGIGRNADAITIFAVHRSASGQGNTDHVVASISRNGGTNARASLGRSLNAQGDIEFGVRRSDGDSYQSANDPTDRSDVWVMVGAEADYVGGIVNVYVNAAVTASHSIGGSGNTSDTDSNVVGVGCFAAGGAGWMQGDWAEVLIIRGELVETDRQKLEGYAAWQWGLQADLPLDHPYAGAAPTI